MTDASPPLTPRSTASAALRAHEEALDKAAHAQTVGRVRRAVLMGSIAWPLFSATDLLALTTFGKHAAPMGVLGPRLVSSVVIAAVALWLYKAREISPRALAIVDQCVYSQGSLSIGIMCLSLGGISSPYLPGACLVVTARMFSMQHTWKRALAANALPALAAPLAVLAGAWLMPSLRPQLHDGRALSIFALYVAFLSGTAAFMAVGSHLIASLRSELSAERSIGKYRLRQRLGLGGMGEVWAAWHAGLKRDVALKILRPAQDSVAAARFEREVQATAELSHPNTIRVFDYGTTEDGLLYYAMELLRGEDLRAKLTREGRLVPEQAVYLMLQAARALAEAHSRGIVHRDVKPDNLFVTTAGGESDFVKVLDFGIARVEKAEGELEITSRDLVVGTPRYMAPEVMRGTRADARADVYGLGAVLYFALTGRPPFEAPEGVALMAALLDAAEAPRVDAPVSNELAEVIATALAKSPERRYANAGALVEALRAVPEAGRWMPRPAEMVPEPSIAPREPTPGTRVLPAPPQEHAVLDGETVETPPKQRSGS